MYWLIGILGLASIAAPFLLNYNDNVFALWTNLIFGAVLLVAALLEAFADDKDTWEYWVVGIAGIGAILAPFILGFNALTAALWTIVAIGIITIVAAGTKIFQSGSSTRLGY
ncbi:MAG: SPW repeat protein [Candidatus Daviesbacteria bacterium]|nr:SPW repeat protein [Candidatus Daviesbacteria bacterium]